MKQKKAFLLSLKNEKEELIKENLALREYIRKDTLEISAPPLPDALMGRVSRRHYGKILLSVLLTAAVVGGLFLLGSSFYEGILRPTVEDNSLSDPDFIPDTAENLNTVGSGSGLSEICAQNGIFYYTEDNRIYRLKDGTETVLAEEGGEWLNIYCYCLYYYRPDTQSVVRFRTDGKDTRILIEGESVRKMEVYRSTVFFTSGTGELKSIYIDGTKEYSVLSGEDILDFSVGNGYICYTVKDEDRYLLRRCTTSGGNAVTVSECDSPALCYADGKFCYLHGGTLYAFDPEEEISLSVFSGVTSFAFLNGNFLLTTESGCYLTDATGGNIRETDRELGLPSAVAEMLGEDEGNG